MSLVTHDPPSAWRLVRRAPSRPSRTLAAVKGFAKARATLPNAITIAGYASSLAWMAGAPWPFALVGLLADEIDGRVARVTGQTSEYGSHLDWAVDLTLTGMAAARCGMVGLCTLPVTTAVQAAMREHGVRPSIGSARAAYTVAALLR